MTNNNEEYVSPHWAGFRSLWWIVAIVLLLLILAMWLLGYGCGGDNCQVPVETVEKIVEVEKIVKVPAAIVPATVAPVAVAKTIAASCEFNPDEAKANIKVIATCTGVETGGNVSIVGMNCGDELDGTVICKTDQSENIGNNPTVATLGASGKSIDSIGDFSQLMPSPEPVETPAARVYFDVSSDKLSAKANYQSLELVIAFLRDHNDSVAYVSGFHDPSGNYESNQELSKRRAQSVGKLLQEAGISSERIIMEKPVETTGTGAPEEARRVEVTIQANL